MTFPPLISNPHLLSLFLSWSRNIGGVEAVSSFTGGLTNVAYRLGGSVNAEVTVNNVLVNRELHNVFGVIKGFVDPGRTKEGHFAD